MALCTTVYRRDGFTSSKLQAMHPAMKWYSNKDLALHIRVIRALHRFACSKIPRRFEDSKERARLRHRPTWYLTFTLHLPEHKQVSQVSCGLQVFDLKELKGVGCPPRSPVEAPNPPAFFGSKPSWTMTRVDASPLAGLFHLRHLPLPRRRLAHPAQKACKKKRQFSCVCSSWFVVICINQKIC